VPVPFDTPGILAVSRRDPGLMTGYLDAPGETAARMSGEWFLTGDTCEMAGDGAITYLGRDDDMMNAGGFRVSPLEVESVLLHYPGITGVAVVEVEVKRDTRVIAAFYTGPAPLDEAAVFEYLHGELARYKTPRILNRVAQLPKGANGKLQRRRLREQYEAEHGKT
jgi:acyl-coenzyme A synthetase/AMP-(fatty) acid ligase